MLHLPEACSLENLPVSTQVRRTEAPLEGYTFQGYRNADGSVGTRNVLAITTTVQCVSGVVEYAVERIRRELLPRYPQVDGVLGLEHTYGCGVAIEAPDAAIPIRTLRNISLNPNFGGQVMVVGLGCEKLPANRLFPRVRCRDALEPPERYCSKMRRMWDLSRWSARLWSWPSPVWRR